MGTRESILVLTFALCCSLIAAQSYSQLMNSDLFVAPPRTAPKMLALVKTEASTSFNPVTFMATLSATDSFREFVPQIRIAAFCPYRDDDDTVFPGVDAYSCANAPASSTRTLIIIETPAGFTKAITDENDNEWNLVTVSDMFQAPSNGGGVLGSSSSTTAAIGVVVLILFVVLVIVGICVCRKKMREDPSAEQQAGNASTPAQRTNNRRRQLPRLRDPEVQYAPVPRPGTTSTDAWGGGSNAERQPREETVEMGPVAGRTSAIVEPASDSTSLWRTDAEASERATAARAAAATTTRASPAPVPDVASVIPSTSLFRSGDQAEAPRRPPSPDESKVGAMDLWAP